MATELACPRCGHLKLWKIHAVPEQQGHGPPAPLSPTLKAHAKERYLTNVLRPKVHEKTVSIGNGRFEALICIGCGYTRWYARDVKADPELQPANHRCTECEGLNFWRVPTLRERASDGLPAPLHVVQECGFGVGHFELFLCRACSRMQWHAHSVARVMEHLPAVTEEHPCASCSGRNFIQVEQFTEQGAHGATPLRAVLRKGALFCSERGCFEILFCRTCGLTEWFAHDLERIEEDPALGVTRVTADGPAPAPIPNGPYR
jgi:predicted nucleic-acid-binding Zn-ribbon protein